MVDGMKIAGPGSTPRARMQHPTRGDTAPVSGHFYIDLRLKAGWTIVPHPSNRLLPEYLEGASVAVHVPPSGGITKAPRRGRPRGSKNKKRAGR